MAGYKKSIVIAEDYTILREGLRYGKEIESPDLFHLLPLETYMPTSRHKGE